LLVELVRSGVVVLGSGLRNLDRAFKIAAESGAYLTWR